MGDEEEDKTSTIVLACVVLTLAGWGINAAVRALYHGFLRLLEMVGLKKKPEAAEGVVVGVSGDGGPITTAGGGAGAAAAAAAGPLRDRKNQSVANGLWFFLGLFGAHHFYLGRIVHGVTCAFSLNFLGLGWLMDAIFLSTGYYVGQANKVRDNDETATIDARTQDTRRQPALLC